VLTTHKWVPVSCDIGPKGFPSVERKQYSCEWNGCTERAPFHLTWARLRRSVREQHLCEQHARDLIERYWEASRVGNGNPAVLEGCKCFDIELIFITETDDRQVIYLREVAGTRSIPIVTGMFEAWGLVLKLQGYESPRPLTHDAMLSAVQALGGELENVLVDNLEGSTYYAKVRLRQDDRLVSIDTRPSDAFVLAVLAERPIFFANEVLAKLDAGLH
jgi:uncharacterized protein